MDETSLHGGREAAAANCPLTSTCMLWHRSLQDDHMSSQPGRPGSRKHRIANGVQMCRKNSSLECNYSPGVAIMEIRGELSLKTELSCDSVIHLLGASARPCLLLGYSQ